MSSLTLNMVTDNDVACIALDCNINAKKVSRYRHAIRKYSNIEIIIVTNE